MNQRIKDLFLYLKEKRIVRNQQDFTERIHSDKSSVSQIINNRIQVPKNIITNIIAAFPSVNPDWLLTGEGPMMRDEDIADARSTRLRDEVVDISPAERRFVEDGIRSGAFRLVPLVNIDSVGGIHSSNHIDPSEQYVAKMLPFSEARQGDVAIVQSGNSMYPTIPSGAVLLIREVPDWREYFGYGNIYVIWLSDGRRITKEIRRYDPDPHNFVWCVSYNPDVADEELPRSMIRGVWKVIKYLADFGW